jgi:uncharacterized protein YndB with AHSA1/START domain
MVDDPRASVVLDVPIADAFELVTDPTTYPDWLVGAQQITSVDDNWPRVGASFRHRIGGGPLRLPGSTTVRDLTTPTRFVLGAGMGPLGEAKVVFDLRPDGTGTRVTIGERPDRGLAKLSWCALRPVAFALLWGRNQISLERLRDLATGE